MKHAARAAIAVALTCAAALAQVAPPARTTTTGGSQVGRGAGPGKAAVAKPSAVPSPSDLKYPPLRPIQAPRVEAVTLPNGMRLYLLEDHEMPVIHGAARIRTGNLFDPPDKIGLASITGAVLRTGGTKSKTGDQLNQQLENLAASVECNIFETNGAVSFFALTESVDEVLGAFHDVLTAPEFAQDKIDFEKSQTASVISRRNDDAKGIALREFTDLVYGADTPYGWQEQYDTVNRITRADLQNFYQRYFFPKNVMLAVWGDFDSARMQAKITKLFADWTVEQAPVPEFPKVKDTPAPGVYLAEKKDVTQTFFAIGHLGGELKGPDFPALEIMADILGGGFHSRLVQRVRTRMGNAYDISASWGAEYDHPGLFEISGSTKSISTVETLKAIQEEVERIRAEEVTEEELRTAKDTALNSMVFAFDTRAKTLARLLTYAYYGYPGDFIQQYQKALMAVTRADVLRVAKQHLSPANLTIAVVGNPVMFGQPLDALGKLVNQLDLTIPEAKVEVLKGDAISQGQAKQILQRAQQAAGGADKLAAVKDYSEVAEFRVTAAAGGMRVVQTSRWIAPGMLRQDNELPAGKVSAYWDGRTGWIATPQGFGALGGAQLKQVQGDLFRMYFRLLLSDQTPERTVNARSSSVVEISDASGQTVQIEFEPDTGLPRRLRYDVAQATGAPVQGVDELDDFREVGGIKIPHRITVMRGGQKFADVTVTDSKLNSGLTVQELGKRQ